MRPSLTNNPAFAVACGILFLVGVAVIVVALLVH
jgi:hypothetical protein